MKKIIDSFRQVGIILAFLLSTTIMFAQQKVIGVVKSGSGSPGPISASGNARIE